MDLEFIMWIYKLTTLYVSLWTPRQPESETGGQTTGQSRGVAGDTNFTVQVDRCLAQFHVLRNRLHSATVGHQGRPQTLYLYIHRHTYCNLYEESLQCLHDLLSRHPSDDQATETVQQRLSQPWALHTNQQCDINVKHRRDHQTPAKQNTKWSRIGILANARTQTENVPTSKVQSDIPHRRDSGTKNSDTASSKLSYIYFRKMQVTQKDYTSDIDTLIVHKEDTNTSKGVAILLKKMGSSRNSDSIINVQEFVKQSKGENTRQQ